MNVDVALVGVVTVPPVPDIMLHAPVPTEGALPARVTVVNPQVADLSDLHLHAMLLDPG